MGIDCDKKSLIQFLKRQSFDSNLNIHGHEIGTAYGEDGAIYDDEEH